MKLGCGTAFSSTSAVACPQSFFSKSPPSTSSSSRRSNRSSRRLLSVKADASSRKVTLSSNWDVSGASTPVLLPRFEELDTTNMLLRQRIVFLGSVVDDLSADFIISQLLFLDAEDQKKDIRLFISSPGGSMSAALGIYDAMKQCKADVSTICLGLAASMGGFLLASGTKGKRFCMPNSRVMIHHPPGRAAGTVSELFIRVREMGYHMTKVNKILSRITGKPYEQVKADTERDYFMNPWEAKEYGLIDGVIDDDKPGLVAPIGEVIPPPKYGWWYLWDVGETRLDVEKLPSEDKFLENGHVGSPGNDGEPKTEEATPA